MINKMVPFLHKLKYRNIFSDSMVGVLFKGANTLCLFSINILVARMLGEQGFGQFTLLLTLFTIGSVFFQAGFPNFIIRSDHYGLSSSGNDSLSFNVFIAGVFIASALLIMALFVFQLGIVQEAIFPVSVDNILINLIFVSAFFSACVFLSNAYLRSQGQSIASITTDQLIIPICILLGVVYLWFSSVPSLRSIIVVYLISNMIGFMLIVFWLKRQCHIKEYDAQIIKGSFFKFDVYMVLGAFPLCLILLNHIPALLLAGSIHADSLAIYRVAYLVALPLLLIAYPINIMAAPYIVKGHKGGDKKFLKEQLVYVVRLITFIGLLYAILVYCFSDFILVVIFEFDYPNFKTLALLLLLNNLLATAFGPVGLILTMIEKERYVLTVLFVTLVTSTLVMIAALEYYGVLGLASLSLLTTVVWKYVLWRKVSSELGVDCSVIANKKVRVSE